jgi:hypothetical protein
MNLNKPTGVPAQQLILKRQVTTPRHREQQPAYNQPAQDTLPPNSSNDS